MSVYKNWKEAVGYLLILPILALWILAAVLRMKDSRSQTERLEALERRVEALEKQ